MKSLLNYIGQIRIYSLLDIIIFGIALSHNTNSIIGIVALWLSFIFLLESIHKDDLRLKISNIIWLVPFIISFIFLPFWLPIIFLALSFAYAQKKKGYWGITSPIFRGLQNGTLAFAFNPALTISAFLLYVARNLIGDFRDAGDDKNKKINTVPTILGLNKNYSLAFWGHLLATIGTTIFWYQYTNISRPIIILIVLLQILSYPLTPRSSNPKWLTRIYNN